MRAWVTASIEPSTIRADNTPTGRLLPARENQVDLLQQIRLQYLSTPQYLRHDDANPARWPT
jgi:predicted SPOUT superfamily RNA methylase MTH1